ncbi:hypothetical protein DFJ73DRAFT_844820 [Zopfochytrium polystomum]|nr:hypothetical protein DFJ73DRAFT_844820 [Zopfochytrium polystomum]
MSHHQKGYSAVPTEDLLALNDQVAASSSSTSSTSSSHQSSDKKQGQPAGLTAAIADPAAPHFIVPMDTTTDPAAAAAADADAPPAYQPPDSTFFLQVPTYFFSAPGRSVPVQLPVVHPVTGIPQMQLVPGQQAPMVVLHGSEPSDDLLREGKPVVMMCPYEGIYVMTMVGRRPSCLAWGSTGLMCMWGFGPCAVIPLFVPSCQNIVHSCSSCRKDLATVPGI